jgi:hydroxylamine reductase
MYCNQCEQCGPVCTTSGPGICGKNPDIQALQETLIYGLKGLAAYAHHARRLGAHSEEVAAFMEEALFATMTNVNFDLKSTLALCLKCGEMNLKVMELLDAAHVKTFGQPAITQVVEGTRAGPGILVTGHDLLDLQQLLKACEGTPVKVYTHGEMLPAHMYPTLRNHPNLAGHYGDAWQKQRWEFDAFPGPILATTNCITIPKESYKDRLFGARVVSAPEGAVILDGDYRKLVELAQRLPPCKEAVVKTTTIGFHHSVIAQHLPAIVDGVKAGKISHFFLIGGCDGAEPGRNYFSDYAKAAPADSFILTLGCGKYRIRGHDYGTHLGFPRLMDMGQCNDAYGAIRVAAALANEFKCTVNDLPLTLVISWFEQKAVAVFLTLLHLGVKNIAVGPNPPAFFTPGVLDFLVKNYGISVAAGDAKADIAKVLKKGA